MKKPIRRSVSIFLALALCFSLCISASAVEGTTVPQDNAITLACNTTEQLLGSFYDITNASGEIKEAEIVPGGVNVVVNVSYSTKIKAETPDDAPYIKGFLAAIEKLTDEQEIEKATVYLNIWRRELEKDHVGNVMAAQSRTSREQELNRILARNYAKDANNFPTGTKPNGSKYAHYNSGCANFVSQCYSAGGVNQDAIWKSYTGAWNYTGGPRKTTGHYGVTDYMMDNGIVFSAGTGV